MNLIEEVITLNILAEVNNFVVRVYEESDSLAWLSRAQNRCLIDVHNVILVTYIQG